ncbi:hypothetical protein GQ457_01G016820 [Hibiscus cannabinus]
MPRVLSSTSYDSYDRYLVYLTVDVVDIFIRLYLCTYWVLKALSYVIGYLVPSYMTRISIWLSSKAI